MSCGILAAGCASACSTSPAKLARLRDTQADFSDGRLLSFITGHRYGL
jgi:hypothetical protein